MSGRVDFHNDYGVDDDQLFRTATGLPASFAAMAGPATFSTVYSAAGNVATEQGWRIPIVAKWEHALDNDLLVRTLAVGNRPDEAPPLLQGD